MYITPGGFLEVSALRTGFHAVIFRRGGEARFLSVSIFAVKTKWLVTTSRWTSNSRNTRTAQSSKSFLLDESLGSPDDTDSLAMAETAGLKNADVLNNVFSTVLTMTARALSNQLPPWG